MAPAAPTYSTSGSYFIIDRPPTKTITSPTSASVTRAPLLTTWSPPASCADAIPSWIGGSCYGSSCSAYQTDTSSSIYWQLTVNAPVPTAGVWLLPNMDCAPPSSQASWAFTYSPAIGCPAGYITGASSVATKDTCAIGIGETRVVCCPSNYPTYRQGLWDLCHQSISATGQTFSRIAWASGSVVDTKGAWKGTYATALDMGQIVLNPLPTSTTIWINAMGIPMIIPATWPPANSTRSCSSTTTSYTSRYTSSSSSRSASKGHRLSGGAIMGVIFSSMALFVVLMWVCICCCQRKTRKTGPLYTAAPATPTPAASATHRKSSDTEAEEQRQKQKLHQAEMEEQDRYVQMIQEAEQARLLMEYQHKVQLEQAKLEKVRARVAQAESTRDVMAEERKKQEEEEREKALLERKQRLADLKKRFEQRSQGIAPHESRKLLGVEADCDSEYGKSERNNQP